LLHGSPACKRVLWQAHWLRCCCSSLFASLCFEVQITYSPRRSSCRVLEPSRRHPGMSESGSPAAHHVANITSPITTLLLPMLLPLLLLLLLLCPPGSTTTTEDRDQRGPPAGVRRVQGLVLTDLRQVQHVQARRQQAQPRVLLLRGGGHQRPAQPRAVAEVQHLQELQRVEAGEYVRHVAL
jgi:hypothetical protein